MPVDLERQTQTLRNYPGKPVYFESKDAFLQSEEGKSHTLTIIAIVYGRETTIHETKNAAKRGKGSALICCSDTGRVVVIPNDANERNAEHIFTVDSARIAFKEDELLMKQINNALHTNLEHRKKKMIPRKRILWRRPHA